MLQNEQIDAGKPFDWGRVSAEYAKYRDIYPPAFYGKIISRGLCTQGQKVLDLGTGTGVLPRNLYRYGAEWVGTDISANQIAYAKRLSADSGQNIRYLVSSAEEITFPKDSFDVVTACQCFWYFDCRKLAPKLREVLKTDGRLLLLYMAWLPNEDPIARASEELVLRYSPNWSGAGETVRPISVPKVLLEYFEPLYHEEYRLEVPFTKETWHGRMKACRGVGASLSPEELARWEAEHLALLEEIAPPAFAVRHYAAMLELKAR